MIPLRDKLARAMAEAAVIHVGRTYPGWEHVGESLRGEALRVADVAIAVMFDHLEPRIVAAVVEAAEFAREFVKDGADVIMISGGPILSLREYVELKARSMLTSVCKDEIQ